MDITTENFKAASKDALIDKSLQAALSKLGTGFPQARLAAKARLPEFEALRDRARDIKEHTLENLDVYLEMYEAKVNALGGQVHWARDGEEARAIILKICQDADAKTMTKSKSMIGEEINLNEYLEDNGLAPIETDMGEYIIQLREEPPSHIIAPAIHLSKEQVADTFREKHTDLPADRSLEDPRSLLDEARLKLRQKFIGADVGFTGANLLVAETGSIAVVTNEGNADLGMHLPRVHVALASIEKVVPTLDDAATILRVLARSATGQDMSVYTTFATGPKRTADADGPDEFHVVLLDNGRSSMLGGEFHDMLRCIRCSACLNHCPVYGSVGGHAYGWCYSGPMGAVLMPNLVGMDRAIDQPNASTLCGKCQEVCPMRIPLPRMLRAWRAQQFSMNRNTVTARFGLLAWGFLAKRPALYRLATSLVVGVLGKLGRATGRFKSMPLAGGWTSKRDLAAPTGKTFMAQIKARKS